MIRCWRATGIISLTAAGLGLGSFLAWRSARAPTTLPTTGPTARPITRQTTASQSASPPTAAAVPVVVQPVRPRPVPNRLAGEHQALQELIQRGAFAEAAALYPEFLSHLAQEWDEASPDLATYHYDFAIALKMAGRPLQSLDAARQARRLWPGNFPLELLNVTTAAELCLVERSLTREVEEGLARLSRPENAPQLRGMRVEPAAIHALRARLYELASRSAEALAAAEEGLALDRRHAGLRECRARALLALERPREAVPILRELLSEKRTAERETFLATALLEVGEVEESWGLLSRLLENRPPDQRSGDGGLGMPLRLKGARALSLLGRPAEARGLLKDVLLEEPETSAALQLLAATLEPPARDALQRRVRELLARNRSLSIADGARAAGLRSSSLYHRAQAALRVDRAGEAMVLLREAVSLSPRLTLLRAELARALEVLGRLELAERELREGIRLETSPLLRLELARILARQGRREESRRMLEAEEKAGNTRGSGEEQAARADAWLELAEPAKARAAFDAVAQPAASSAPDEVAGDGTLLRAEIAYLEGRMAEARSFLREGAAAGWREAIRERALGAALSVQVGLSRRGDSSPTGERTDEQDPSDFLDLPRLIPPGEDGALRQAHARRMSILASLRGQADESAGEAFRALYSLYTEVKARRKAREIAWYLVHLRPDGVEERRQLARALERPEEWVVRMSVIARARRLLAGDTELERWWSAGAVFLGWGPP